MARPFLVHVDRRVRKGPGDVSDAAGMIEMDVGHRHPAQVSGRHPELGERLQEHRDRALASRLDQQRRVPVHEVSGGHPLPTAKSVSIWVIPGAMQS